MITKVTSSFGCRSRGWGCSPASIGNVVKSFELIVMPKLGITN